MKKFIKIAALVASTWTVAEMVTQYRINSEGKTFAEYVSSYISAQTSLTSNAVKRNYQLASNGDFQGAFMATINDLKPLK